MDTVRTVPGPDLSPGQLYDLLRLRVDVFVVEQACPYPEVDGRDLLPSTTHLWVEEDGQVATTLRLLDADGPQGALVVGRVVTAPAFRGRALAGQLMQHVLDTFGDREMELEAQSHLADWYGRFGFQRTGPDFDWDGIDHTPMRRRAGAPTAQ